MTSALRLSGAVANFSKLLFKPHILFVSVFLSFVYSVSISAEPVSRQIEVELFNKNAQVQAHSRIPRVSRVVSNFVNKSSPRFSVQMSSPREQLFMVVLDGEGREIHQAVVENPLVRRIEAFEEHSGEVEESRFVERESGTLFLSLPEKNDISTLVFYRLSGKRKIEVDRISVGPAVSRDASFNANSSISSDVFSIIQTGDPDNRSDLVLVAEGYTASELSKFERDAERIVQGYFQESPYSEYKNHFNVWGVRSISNVSGAGNNDQRIDTAFGARFGCYGIQRLLCVDERNVENYVRARMNSNQVDQILVVVNTTTYGGAGGRVATMSLAPAAIDLALHEVGHSYGYLADEYDYGTCYSSEPREPNATATRGAKWAYWEGVDGVSWYEGSRYCASGMYRPTNNSMMRTLGYPFHAVNTEALILKTYEYVDPIDAVIPSQRTVDISASQEFRLTTVKPIPNSLTAQWFIDGRQVASGERFTMRASDYSLGSYTLSVSVKDETDAVRRDPSRLTEDSHSWNVTISGNGGGCDELEVAPSGLAASGVTSTSFVAQWNEVDGADSYDIEILQSGEWSATNTRALTQNFSGLIAGSSHTIRVRATNACSSGPYSASVNVQLDQGGSCDSAQRVSGLSSESITYEAFTLTWPSASNAASYIVELWNGSEWLDHRTTENNSIRLNGFTSGSTQYVRVASINNCGERAQASSWIEVNLGQRQCQNVGQAGQPTISSVTNNSFVASWQAADNAELYRIQLWSGESWDAYSSTSSLTIQVEGVSGSTAYVRVIGENACGTQGQPSSWTAVSLGGSCNSAPDTPVRPTVSGGQISWPAISGASRYKVQQWNGSRWLDYTEVSSPGLSINANTPYYVRVNAVNDCGESAYSDWVQTR